MYAKIKYRNGGCHLTEISDEQTPETLAVRMVSGGFVICHDSRWGKERWIIVKLEDVSYIELEKDK